MSAEKIPVESFASDISAAVGPNIGGGAAAPSELTRDRRIGAPAAR